MSSGTHWRVFNFLVFVSLLYFGLRRSVAEFWRGRRQGLSSEIEEAKRLHQEAGRRVYDLEVRLARLDQEIEGLVRTLREEGELEKKRMIEQAKRLGEKLGQNAERILEQEVQKAQVELKRQVVDASLAIAHRLIQERLTDTDQGHLAQSYLRELETTL